MVEAIHRTARRAGLDPGKLRDFRRRVEAFKAKTSPDPYERAKAGASKKVQEAIETSRP